MPGDSNKFTERAQNAIRLSQSIAKELGHSYVGSEHLLLGLLKEDGGIGAITLKKCGFEYTTLRRQVIDLVGEGAPIQALPQGLTLKAKHVIETAVCEAIKMDRIYIGTEHILLAILKERDCVAYSILQNSSIHPLEIYTCLVKVLGLPPDSSRPIPREKSQQKTAHADTKLLNTYGRDLTQLAMQDKLDPVYGRDAELMRMIRILCRRTKNNPLLLGDAGVGKTALAEGLARMIVANRVPDKLKDHRVVSLDISSMVAGTKYRGEFEERIRSIIREVTAAQDVILFVDELHNIVGAGSAEGAVDAANILKPSLARGEIKLIGATTLDEYKKYIQRDFALERRFQVLMIEEPSIPQSIGILTALRERYEAFHHVEISDKAISTCCNLAHKYMNDRHLPDSAIDLMDEASAMVALSGGRYVSADDVASVTSVYTGIPCATLTESDEHRLLNLEDELSCRVFGQENAIRAVCRALRRSYSGVRDEARPIGSFIFSGPSGVGKTELCRALADCIFKRKNSFIRLDMSEYSDAASISKLIGSPPGYVGYDEGGQLTDKVRQNPYSIVLFDEIEKAHPDIYNILLQILEDGKLTDAHGITVSFKNALVVLTTNAKCSISSLGFVSQEKNQLQGIFKPELLNRIDEVICFKPLSQETAVMILDSMFASLCKRLKSRGITVSMDNEALNSLATRVFDNKIGARSLRHGLQKEVEDKLAEAILKGKLHNSALLCESAGEIEVVCLEESYEKA